MACEHAEGFNIHGKCLKCGGYVFPSLALKVRSLLRAGDKKEAEEVKVGMLAGMIVAGRGG